MSPETISLIVSIAAAIGISTLFAWFVYRCMRALFNELKREYAPYIGELRHCQKRLEDDTKRHIREAVERMDAGFARANDKLKTLIEVIELMGENGIRNVEMILDKFEDTETLIKQLRQDVLYMNTDFDEMEDRIIRLEYKPQGQITGPTSATMISSAPADFPPRRMRRRRGL